MRKLRILLALGFAALAFQPVMAQDSTVKAPDTTVATPPPVSDTAVAKSPTVDITNIPTTSLIYTILTFMGAFFVVLMPAIQLVLKKIPGTSPIGGILGKILNVATWWEENVKVPPKP